MVSQDGSERIQDTFTQSPRVPAEHGPSSSSPASLHLSAGRRLQTEPQVLNLRFYLKPRHQRQNP